MHGDDNEEATVATREKFRGKSFAVLQFYTAYIKGILNSFLKKILFIAFIYSK